MAYPTGPEGTTAPAGNGAELARSRRREVMTGLLLSFAGLALASLLFPSGEPALVRALPAAGAGLLLLWVGGILMGNGMRPFGRRRAGAEAASPPAQN